MSENSPKVPSPIFKWFEKMKGNYEQSVQNVLKKFEDHHSKQQQRFDQAIQSHLKDLKQSHNEQIKQQNTHITQLKSEVEYFKQQIDKQQQTIEQLNGRYDTVVACLITDKNKKSNIKDIFAEGDFITPKNNELLTSEVSTPIREKNSTETFSHQNKQINTTNGFSFPDDNLFDQAIVKRQSGEQTQAFDLFQQAAKQGHAKAMGAMGRSFFLGEGITEDHSIGLAWLIQAANQDLPQAIDRVKHFQQSNPDLYQEALLLSDELL